MGFLKPDLPDVDHDTWLTQPRRTRLQVVTRDWVEHGFGTPYAVYLLYLTKIAVYVAAGAAIISLTPGLGGLSRIGDWWTQPIVYQKVIVFTLLFEVLGFGCGSGPLTGRFWPPIGGFLYWLRPNTIRLPAWPDKVPFTQGDTRTVVDVALYAIVLIGGVWALLSPGSPGPGGTPVTAAGDVGLINPVLVVPTIVALGVLGLRDKTIFLAARGEHYWLKLFVFFFPFTDQIAAFKIIMLCLWWGAATSKLNHHFPYVVAVMTSNNALLRSRVFNPIKHLLYRDHANDLRPSWLPTGVAPRRNSWCPGFWCSSPTVTHGGGSSSGSWCSFTSTSCPTSRWGSRWSGTCSSSSRCAIYSATTARSLPPTFGRRCCWRS